MKKLLLSSAVLLAATPQFAPAYAFTDLGIKVAPQPKSKRGKFKRRNKGSKK